MEIIPSAKVTRFEQLEPGELFLYIDGRYTFYALKTQQRSSGNQSMMVMLGPSFIEDSKEAFLLPWQGATVLSLGRNFSIILPTEAAAWSWKGPSRVAVCLAISEDAAFICANGGFSPQQYFPCFVDVKTGAVIEGRIPASALFTNTWEIAVLGPNHPPLSVLKYPLPEGG
jgi:hypothetical protein